MLAFLLSLALAQEVQPEVAETITVEASRDIQFYVAPIRVYNLTETQQIESVVDTDAAYTYSGSYWRNAQVPNDTGGYMPVLLGDRDVMIYNKRSIQYAWDNCNYNRDPLGCAIQNDHFYIETVVHVDDHQLVVKSTMYNSNAQIVSVSRRTDDMIITWIKQQEVTHIQKQDRSGTTNLTHYGKEELPLRWDQPHKLMDRTIQQTMLGLWSNIRLY